MKILVVSWSILPRAGGTSVIVENLAKNFSAAEMLVVGARELQLADVPERSLEQAQFRYFFSEISIMGRGNRFFDWFRRWRLPALIRQLKQLIKTEKITHVIGVYPNVEYCLAASRAAQQMGVPFYSYFHNTYVENVAITDPKALDYQTEIFTNSQRVFVMSEGMQQFYIKKYQLDKFVPLVHTFAEYPSETLLTGISEQPKKHYKLVAIGNFNESNLDATRRFLNAIKGDPIFSFHVYTHVPKLLLQQRGLEVSQIHHHGSVAPTEIHVELQKYDLCILTHGFTGGYGEVEYQTIFPTRTIPFLLSGKPIVAHSPDGSFLNNFIKKNHCAELLDMTDEAIILQRLKDLCADVTQQKQLVAAAQKTSEQFYGKNVAQFLKEELLIG
ncbi:MAG: glycosyltransferase [Saprospiraceae bacterium]